jgi:hypothetical protein
MLYALLGKVFVSLIIILIVWIITMFVMSRDDKDGGGIMAAFWFIGPVLGVVTAVIAWIYILPPL